MASATTAGDFDSLTCYARNAERPSVIFFSGLQNKDESRAQLEESDMVFAKSNQTKLHHNMRNCSTDSDEYDIEDEDQYERNTQGGTYFQSNDNLLDNTKPRQRTSFTKLQRNRLEEEFNRDAYIIGMKRWRLSEELEVPEKKIKIWFQNRRTKMKKGY